MSDEIKQTSVGGTGWIHPGKGYTVPNEPAGEDTVYYRGWEASYDGLGSYAAVFGDGRWVSYKGGCDLGAPEVTASTWKQLLELIDDEEKEYEQTSRSS